MKNLFLLTLFSLFSTVLSAANSYSISHGPYLQEVTCDGATFVFTTSDNGFSSIDLRESGSDLVSRHYDSQNGLRNTNNTFNAIRVEGLKPGTKYQYRINSTRVNSFAAYSITFGDSIKSPWYDFSTVNPKSKGASIFITSDIHNDAVKLEKLLELCSWRECSAFFYAGDMMSHMTGPDTPFDAFIDTSTKLFAKSIPFELVRGNHETRGPLARTFPQYFPKRNNKIYGSYLLGDVMVVMIDCGEDKPDSLHDYGGFVDFDNYRQEQADWLATLVKSKEFKNARYRIVISHFPAFVIEGTKNTLHGRNDLASKILPILNKAKIDLMISGHTHRYAYNEPDPMQHNFPILVGSNHSATRLDIADGHIHIKAIDLSGEVLLDKIL